MTEEAEQRWRSQCWNLRVPGGKGPPNRVRQRPGRGGCRPPSLESHQLEGNNVLPQSVKEKRKENSINLLSHFYFCWGK